MNPYFSGPNPGADPADRDRSERLPQWTQAETRELLAVRAELDRSFAESKRNKALWEAVAARLQHKGFARTPDQCKSKWKNLVNRFKGSEAAEGPERFPFQEEMRRIFSERRDRSGNAEEEEEPKKRRRKAAATAKEGEAEAAIREFAVRQEEMWSRRVEAAEAREAERRAKEEEWRREMEALAEERAAAERRWMEREEERRARAEARDERRHAVIVDIVTRLARRGD